MWIDVDILGVDFLGVDILGVDILGVDCLGVDILGVDILRVDILGRTPQKHRGECLVVVKTTYLSSDGCKNEDLQELQKSHRTARIYGANDLLAKWMLIGQS